MKIAVLKQLRSAGVLRATFHADGKLASVEFAPSAAVPLVVKPQSRGEAPAPAQTKDLTEIERAVAQAAEEMKMIKRRDQLLFGIDEHTVRPPIPASNFAAPEPADSE